MLKSDRDVECNLGGRADVEANAWKTIERGQEKVQTYDEEKLKKGQTIRKITVRKSVERGWSKAKDGHEAAVEIKCQECAICIKEVV